MAEDQGPDVWQLTLAEDVTHVGAKLLVRWLSAPEAVSSRRDFIALYPATQENVRKYTVYKVVEKEGLTEGIVEFLAPSSPGEYFFKYCKPDYTEVAISSTLVVRSALSVLLDEVKAQGMSGNTEAVLEMFETVMLQLKVKDDAFHKQALDSWRELQQKRTPVPHPQNPQPESSEPAAIKGGEHTQVQTEDPSVSEATTKETDTLVIVKVRGSGYYAQGRDAQGDSRFVMTEDRILVEGDATNAKQAAGLHLLVLRLADLSVILSQTYDTHNDQSAAQRMSDDLASYALENQNVDPSKILVVVTSQYAWEGYFSSTLLCDRLARCGANLDRLLAVQRNMSSWMSSTYSTPYVLTGVPGRRSGLRFSAEAWSSSEHSSGKKQAAELELALVRCEEEKEFVPMAIRTGPSGEWSWALPGPSESTEASILPPTYYKSLALKAHGTLSTLSSLSGLSEVQRRLIRAAVVAIGRDRIQMARGLRVAKGQLRPVAILCQESPEDHELLWASAAIAAEMSEVEELRGRLLNECLEALVETCGKRADPPAEPPSPSEAVPLQALILDDTHAHSNGHSHSHVLDVESGSQDSLQGTHVPSTPGDCCSTHVRFSGLQLIEVAQLDAGRCLCNLINDPKFSLHKDIIALFNVQTPNREVQRSLVLRISEMARDAELAKKIASSPSALKVLCHAIIPEEGELPGGPEEELRADALLGLAGLCALPELRVELLRQGILEPVIRALPSGNGATDAASAFQVATPQRNALRIVRELAQARISVCKLSVHAEVEGEDTTNAPLEPVFAVAATGFWERVVTGRVAVATQASFDKNQTHVCDIGDIVVVPMPQKSRDSLVAILRQVQASRGAAVIAHVGSLPAPFPMLQHLPRDYTDVQIPTLLLPSEEVTKLHEAASNFVCSAVIYPPMSCRQSLASRAVPLLQAMLKSSLVGSSEKQEPIASVTSADAEQTGNSGGSGALAREGRKSIDADAEFKLEVHYVLRLLGAHHRRTVSGRGVRILAMDGGGIRGLVLVELLRKVEADTGRPITESFDIVCGTSTGGLMAMALLTGKSLDDIEEQYMKISATVFKKGWFTTATQLTTTAKYDARILEERLREQYGTGSLLDTPLKPHCFVVSTLASVMPPQPYLWRTYSNPVDTPSRYCGTSDASLITALRATSAAPSFFDDVLFDNGRHIDGGVIANNPTALAIHEASRLFPGSPVECVVSLATGLPPIRATPGAGVGLYGLGATVIDSASGVNRVAHCLEDLLPPDVYFRFSPEGSAFEMGLDQTERNKIEELQGATHQYIVQQTYKFNRLKRSLVVE